MRGGGKEKGGGDGYAIVDDERHSVRATPYRPEGYEPKTARFVRSRTSAPCSLTRIANRIEDVLEAAEDVIDMKAESLSSPGSDEREQREDDNAFHG